MPEDKKPDVILMDDGYQHRSVIPSLSICWLTATADLKTNCCRQETCVNHFRKRQEHPSYW